MAVVEVDGPGRVGGHSGATSCGVHAGRLAMIGYYLRATATYSDGLGTGRDSASGVTAFAVERRPAANSQPSFAVQDEDANESRASR